MKNSKKNKQPDKDGNVPRQVRMPPILDDWLTKKAEASAGPAGSKSIADIVREIVAEARERELAA